MYEKFSNKYYTHLLLTLKVSSLEPFAPLADAYLAVKKSQIILILPKKQQQVRGFIRLVQDFPANYISKKFIETQRTRNVRQQFVPKEKLV